MKSAKIGLYARVSSEAQAKEKTIESQISVIIDHAESLENKIALSKVLNPKTQLESLVR